MKCKMCGLENLENAKFCSGCGEALVEEPVEVVQEPVTPHVPRCFDVFAKLGFGLGLGGLIGCIAIGLGFIAAIPGIVFSILGKRSITYHSKAVTGLVLSIIGTVVGIIIFYVIYIILLLNAMEPGYDYYYYY